MKKDTTPDCKAKAPSNHLKQDPTSKYIIDGGRIFILDNFRRIVDGTLVYFQYPAFATENILGSNWYPVDVIEKGYRDPILTNKAAFSEEKECQDSCDVINRYCGFTEEEGLKLVGVSMGLSSFFEHEVLDITGDENALNELLCTYPYFCQHNFQGAMRNFHKRLLDTVQPRGRSKSVIKLDNKYHVYCHGGEVHLDADRNGWFLKLYFKKAE